MHCDQSKREVQKVHRLTHARSSSSCCAPRYGFRVRGSYLLWTCCPSWLLWMVHGSPIDLLRTQKPGIFWQLKWKIVFNPNYLICFNRLAPPDPATDPCEVLPELAADPCEDTWLCQTLPPTPVKTPGSARPCRRSLWRHLALPDQAQTPPVVGVAEAFPSKAHPNLLSESPSRKPGWRFTGCCK